MPGPLEGVKIVEMAGIGPAPFGCYLLAGLGAAVTRIEAGGRAAAFLPLDPATNPDVVMRAIREIDLKSDDGRAEAISLIDDADVLVEGFRPGVMERLGLGPEPMLDRNPRLVFARMTGYGQTGPMSKRAGHDLNYIATSGVLSLIGREGAAPTPPLNLVGDYAGGSMVMVMGILAALFERERTGQGKVIDISMVEGSAMVATPIFAMMAAGLWDGDRHGTNLLDTGCPFYDTYETADGKFVAVAPLEPQFFANLVDTLHLGDGWKSKQYDRSRWPELRLRLETIFLSRPRDEWSELFADIDACVTPVLTPDEAARNDHNTARQSFADISGKHMPRLAPRFQVRRDHDG